MRTPILLTAMTLIGGMYCALAGSAVNPQAVFPGDLGRPLNGLPLPDSGPRRPPWPYKPPPARGPSMDVALLAAEATVAACKGYHVSVSIIDSAGTPKLYYVPDGTAGYNAYTGFRKAYTALIFKKPTSEVGELSKHDPALAARITADTNLLSFAGGLPLLADGKLIGAIGVSGSIPSSVDERCARAGIDRIRKLLQ